MTRSAPDEQNSDPGKTLGQKQHLGQRDAAMKRGSEAKPAAAGKGRGSSLSSEGSQIGQRVSGMSQRWR